MFRQKTNMIFDNDPAVTPRNFFSKKKRLKFGVYWSRIFLDIKFAFRGIDLVMRGVFTLICGILCFTLLSRLAHSKLIVKKKLQSTTMTKKKLIKKLFCQDVVALITATLLLLVKSKPGRMIEKFIFISFILFKIW